MAENTRTQTAIKDMEDRITTRLETRLMELTPNIQKSLDASLTNSIQEPKVTRRHGWKWIGRTCQTVLGRLGHISVTMDTEKDDVVDAHRETSFMHVSDMDGRNNRVALFDGIEEGGIRASSLYSTSSHEIGEHDNEQALDGLQKIESIC
ncbi:hypothetical protein VNO80_04159 [Phaseolus coccineus]|uniref:Uncharacterized protein n=1 Tax=Phaseolus coccineus TaxID=3886 RepID=A0AAN9P092_PHACN